MADVRARLGPVGLAERAVRLGFRDRDLDDLQQVTARVLADDRVDDVRRMAVALTARIGSFLDPEAVPNDPWRDPAATDAAYGAGVLPMLALLASADEVVAFHAARGIDEQTSWASLADLGQQVWVHRLTYGEFGLHTQGWLLTAWSGALLWLGRLQFELRRLSDGPEAGEWTLSVHIPQSGPLRPESVDASLGAAPGVFAGAFPEQPVRTFHCHSWLLDPQLADVLPADSNLVRFQRRWTRYGEAAAGDDDVIFFVFRRRGPVELNALPQDTTLERAVVERIRSGGHWHVCNGLIQIQGEPR